VANILLLANSLDFQPFVTFRYLIPNRIGVSTCPWIATSMAKPYEQ
jgi:hypothetical protein